MSASSDEARREGSITRSTLDAHSEAAPARAEATSEAFFTMLAHELRNPLAPIRSAVEIMRMIGQKDPALEKAREMISRQVDHLSRIVDQLVDVSHMTRGTFALEDAPVDVNAVLWRAVEIAQPMFDERQQDLRVLPLAQAVSVRGDFQRLVQIVGNLLDNAARYTQSGGQIVLSAARDGAGIAVRVKDNGMGIAAESLPVIFDLFRQGHGAERPQGLGIGLSLVRDIAERHGGCVEATSPGLGRGSEFTVRLPLSRRPRDGVPARAAPPGRETPRRIVLIDDNVDGTESLAMLLRLKGHDVHVAYDGPAGLALALRVAPDCVLIDIGLPGMDGYEVARQLRAQAGSRALLVALTGFGQAQDRRKSEQAGFDHHLVKPVAHSVLDELLREP